jgi:DNA polymerase-3 subunit gamma/tau
MPRFIYRSKTSVVNLDECRVAVSVDPAQTGLLNKYRPANFDKVLGQDAAVASLQEAIKQKRGRAFLFTGRSGIGKTSLAYIAAAALGCKPTDRIEIDAATNGGVDDMWELASRLIYRPLGGGAKAIILDECHMLSRSAWNGLLKPIEQPPEHACWLLCTTEPTKVPDTIRSRCLHYDLKPIGYVSLVGLVNTVAEREHIKLADGVARLCAKEAEGSARQALANLAICANAKSRDEAAEYASGEDHGVLAIDVGVIICNVKVLSLGESG